MRSVGALYLAMFVLAAIVAAPIRVMAPAALRATDATSRLLVSTWITLGLEYLVIGGALLLLSRVPDRARGLVVTVLWLELVRGIGTDMLMLARGFEPVPQLIWIAVHAVVIASGIACLRRHVPSVPALAS
jgi:hypothetical protein